MAHFSCHHTLSESGHVQCPFCAAMNEATVTNRDDPVPMRDGRTVIVTVPVWTCGLCRESWTDCAAEAIRDRALQHD